MPLEYKWTNTEALDKIAYEIWEVGYDAEHAPYIEFGTRPHTPPFGPIYKWCTRKLNLHDKEAKKAAWAIINTIKNHGTEEHPYLRPAIQAIRNKIEGKPIGGIGDIAEMIFNESQDNIIRMGITDSGTLLKSGYYKQIG